MKINNEDFKHIGMARIDTKNRITLGGILKRFKLLRQSQISNFETYIGDNGDILLRPMANIPARELWIHQNPSALKSIQQGFKDIREESVTKAENLDKFFEEL